MKEKKIDYKSSGVDILKADRLVSWIKKQKSFASSPLGSDYASFVSFSPSRYQNPVLACSTDGIGTKVKLARYFSQWGSLGQDLVAMCVNDLICVGAHPLAFLDYYACGQLDLNQSKSFLRGLHKACEQASCPLIGGETAELPGMYSKGDIDCAGFALGVVDKGKILGPQKVRLGDEIVALKSSGFHSNGYSLLRKIYKTSHDLNSRKKILMEPTRLYTFLLKHLPRLKGLRAMAHITGGGLDNLLRILPAKTYAQLHPWLVPSCFLDVKTRAKLSWPSLLKTLNCGLGFILILRKKEEFLKQNIVHQKDLVVLGQVCKSKKTKPYWDLDFKSMDQKNHV